MVVREDLAGGALERIRHPAIGRRAARTRSARPAARGRAIGRGRPRARRRSRQTARRASGTRPRGAARRCRRRGHRPCAAVARNSCAPPRSAAAWRTPTPPDLPRPPPGHPSRPRAARVPRLHPRCAARWRPDDRRGNIRRSGMQSGSCQRSGARMCRPVPASGCAPQLAVPDRNRRINGFDQVRQSL